MVPKERFVSIYNGIEIDFHRLKTKNNLLRIITFRLSAVKLIDTTNDF